MNEQKSIQERLTSHVARPSPFSREGDVSRRQFISGAGLTAAGAAVGLSFYFSRDPIPRPERSPVKLGFIGVGSRGGALLRTMLNVPGSEVVAVSDVNPEAVDAARENIQDRDGKSAEPFTTDDYRELLGRPEVQAVVIATPHFMHGPMAVDALEAGKHVYCEKAMAFTIGECLDIYNLSRARAQKQVFQVGHQRHYSKMYRKVRDMVLSGQIGNVTAIRAHWNRSDAVVRPCSDPRMERIVNWRLYSEYSGGLMSEFASHQIDVANMVLGTPAADGRPAQIAFPQSVCGAGGLDYPRFRKQPGRDTHDNVHVIFTYDVPYRERKEVNGEVRWLETGERYKVRFTYMSVMTNELLSNPTELILGDEGSIEVGLAGGDFWKEPKALGNPVNQAEGTNPASTHQKKILKTGATIAVVTKGVRKADQEILIKKDREDWSEFVKKIPGEHSPQETLLALDSFLEQIRKCGRGEPYQVDADAGVGIGSAAASILGNMAIRQEKTLAWADFGLPPKPFPPSDAVPPPPKKG